MRIKNLYGGVTEISDKMFESVPNMDEIKDFIYTICNKSSSEEEFYLYMHKTHKENIASIVRKGLMIYEDGGGISLTMDRVFRTETENRDLWINYALNSMITSNAYGNYSVIVLLSKSDYIQLLTANRIPQKHIVLVLDPNGKIIYSTINQIIEDSKFPYKK